MEDDNRQYSEAIQETDFFSKPAVFSTTFLIVGGGIAGVSCAETITYLCPNEKVILLSENNLIKAVKNLVPLARHVYKFDIEERDANDELLSGGHVTTIVDQMNKIQSREKYILTVGGRTIYYEYLCLCTGARPKLIKANNERIIGIRDTDSVIDFQMRIKESRKLVLVGNGGIASELAFEVKNVEIDWIIKDDHISSTFVDAGAAFFFQESKKSIKTDENPGVVKRMRYSETVKNTSKRGPALGPDWHRKINMVGNREDLQDCLQIHYNSQIETIENFSNEDFPLLVTLVSGKKIPCDLLVSATGVDPQMDFTIDEKFVLGQDGGVFINELMETNISRIYAAGDVCFAGWNTADNWFQMRLWTQARQMGAMAGRSMSATFKGETVHQDFCFELFGHVTNLFGYQVVLLGHYNGQGLGTDYEILLRTTPGKEYIKFVLQNGKLRGAILIGDTGLEETCENLILNQLDLTPFGDDILNPDIDIEDYFD